MYQSIEAAKLVDVRDVADKLSKLPENVLLYIAGYTEGALATAGNQTDAAQSDG